jgi:RNA polymerase sigma factor (sigma-70 family)
MRPERRIWIGPADDQGNPRLEQAAYAIEQSALRYRQGELRDEGIAVALLEAAVHIGSRAGPWAPIANPAAYLRKIFARLVDDEVDRRHRFVSVEAAGLDERLTAKDGCHDDIERVLLVETLLERMDSQTRRVVEARMIGMSIEEIATELGVTTNCVSQRLKNGLERLRKGLHFKP